MFDAHHDLLTIAYQAYITGDYSYLNKISNYFNDNNVNKTIYYNQLQIYLLL